MLTTKVFISGKSQAVRIPKNFRFDCDEVYIEKQGEQIILRPKPKSWDDYFNHSSNFSDDVPNDIDDLPMQNRDEI